MYDPALHHRRSIRLPGYDYSGAGLYFLTICVQGRACLFGEIIDGEMQLNDAGRMVAKWYAKLEEKFPDIRCGEYVVMPNHFHCIVENAGIPVGADPCVRPTPNTQIPNTPTPNNPTLNTQIPNSLAPNTPTPNNPTPNAPTGTLVGPTLGEHTGSPLRVVVQWFKTMTTNEYIRNVKANNWTRFDGKLWQRNYWEHIIRNGTAHQQIADYIIGNPRNWEADSINPIHEKQQTVMVHDADEPDV